MTRRLRTWLGLAVLVTALGSPACSGPDKSKNSWRVESSRKRHKAAKGKKHASHEHEHTHPHGASGHHHHAHPHPHLPGPDGHHHPY